MFQRDYIMRLIEQLSQAVGAMLGLKKEMKQQEAVALVGETFKRLFGLNPGLIRALSERDLIDLLNRDGEASAEKMLVFAALLKEEAELLAELDKSDEAYRLSVKALNISLIAAADGPSAELFDTAGQVDSMLRHLSGYEVPKETKLLLWPYFESAGRYADAEDVLFELFEDRTDEDAYKRLLSEAEQFYNRLLNVETRLLEAGRLPRDEVLEGIEALAKLRRQLQP